MKKIYNHLIAKAVLTAPHKEELVKQRGFTPEIIARFKFRSGGAYLMELESEMIRLFDQKNLLGSGLFIQTGKTIHFNKALLVDKIIIPYLDANGDVYFLRPHKLGLTNLGIRIYHEYNIAQDSDTVILTEGEYKAVAGMQYGINTIGIPGITSFSEKYFPVLLDALSKYNIRKVYTLFDNEVKDDPAFKNYKENPANRYDTQFYAYYMAKRLQKEGYQSLVATFPDSWRVNGKIDFDGALAQGRTKSQILQILDNAKTCAEYLKTQTREAKEVMLRKNRQKTFKSAISVQFGHYMAHRVRGRFDWDEVISNFTIQVIATHKTPEGIIRDLVFVDEQGKISQPFSIEGNDMVGADSFASFAIRHGNYVWKGTKDDLAVIWERLFLDDDGRVIVEPDHIGWIENEKIWLFGNVSIKEKTEYRPDNNHVFWYGTNGIKPIPLGVTSGKTVISEGIPYLQTNAIDIHKIKDRLSDTIGENYTNICLGWITAVLFMGEVFKKYGCFPFLFITGRRGSGKSTIAEWLMNFYGLENCGKMASDTTSVGLQRYLSYYSSLPVYLDEYRNTKDIMRKNGMLRNCYNKQSAGKGIKASFGVREAKVRGTLLISGEELPEDNALLTRCVSVMVKDSIRKENHFNWFMANRLSFSWHTYDILRRKETLTELFMKTLDKAKDAFTDRKIDDRTAINYAVVAAGYYTAFGFQNNANFAGWISQETMRVMQEQQSEQIVNVFFEDLLAMKIEGAIDNRYWKYDEENLYLYFAALYNLWSQYYRKTRGSEPFKRGAILKYLQDESGYRQSNILLYINEKRVRCVVFDRNEAPEDVKTLVDFDEEEILL